jgi:CDP-glucose 4,6-dehydratase
MVKNPREFFRGRRVWLSGHTGFKGSWLSLWLLELGAHVHGYAQPPDTETSLFEQLSLASSLEHEISDIRNEAAVASSIREFQPEVVIHMAAQPLVRRSYAIPVETFETNTMGTVHVLEAMRQLTNPCAAVIVTTDKCYENHESGRAYEERDSLGGHDPYSASKAMAEVATSAYRDSFFQNHPVRVASARAGNVIGGGDWAEDRIVPDAMRSIDAGLAVPVRNPNAVRPWQHVLEPLGGYLLLAAGLSPDPSLAGAFNFGPGPDANRSVRDLTVEMLKHREGAWKDASDPSAPHEATLLNLSIAKARGRLGWNPLWDFPTTVEKTVAWYRNVRDKTVTPLEMTLSQIREYDRELFNAHP